MTGGFQFTVVKLPDDSIVGVVLHFDADLFAFLRIEADEQVAVCDHWSFFFSGGMPGDRLNWLEYIKMDGGSFGGQWSICKFACDRYFKLTFWSILR